jgi:predicted GTPase
VDDYQRELVQRSIETRLAFLKFANLHFISAIKRQGLGPVWTSIAQAHTYAMRDQRAQMYWPPCPWYSGTDICASPPSHIFIL